MTEVTIATERPRRIAVGVILPVLALVVSAIALGTANLPDPVASHWSAGGEPNDSIGRGTFVGLFSALMVVTGSGALWASRRREIHRGDLVAPVAAATLIQWIFVGVTVAVAWANDGATTWRDTRGITLPLALLIPVAAAAIAGGTGALVRGIGPPRPSSPETRPTVDRVPGEQLVWVRRMNTRWPLVLGAAIAILGTELILLIDPLVGAIVLLAAAIVAMLAWIHVTADQRGLTVSYGPFRWPRTHIDLDRIEEASVIDVAPMRHGGWGYRGSVTVFGRAAVVVRSGEGLRLDLQDGKRFTVTVDDAGTAAGTINDLIGA